MAEDWRTVVQALAADHRSPASVLAQQAAQLLSRLAESSPASLIEAGRALVRAQPAMASVVTTANVALRTLESLGAASVPGALAALQHGIDTDRRAAARALCAAVDAPVGVVTISVSGNVVAALEALRAADLLRAVVCGEARPLLEGTALARWLAEAGYDVTLVADAALPEYLLPGTMFLAGTDAILPDAVVNKRGTRGLATWAKLSGVPRFVLATRDKIYPPDLVTQFDDPERDPRELIQDPPARLRIENRAFDRTPLAVWSAIWVGGTPLAAAAASGDRSAARALRDEE
jgi:translation initiation factor 2B subunit (eIF-2B alpha/beta/delta family)